MSVAVEEPRTQAETRPGPDGKPETQEQREDRLFNDRTRIEMSGIAAMMGTTNHRVRVLNSARARARTIVKDGIVPPRKGRNEQPRPATPLEVAEAKAYLTDALPQPVDRYAQTDVWERRQIAKWLSQTKRVDEWFEPKRKSPPGKARTVVLEDGEQ